MEPMYCDRNICIENEYNGIQCDECKVTKSQRGGERMKINISPQNLGALCICAIRYCHGRQTYMPGKVQEIVKSLLKYLSDKDIGVMLEDCDYQERNGLYGDEAIDKPGWIEFRERLTKEKERREK